MKHYLAGLLLVALWAAVLAIWLTPAPPQLGGAPHERIPKMDQAGNGADLHSPRLVLVGWVFGALLIAGFVGLLAWVTVPAAGEGGAKRAVFLLGGLLFEGVFAMMCIAYARALNDQLAEPFWGGFPASTAWLVYGLWPVPTFFIVLYVVFFNSWIAPPQQLRQFEQLVEDARSNR